MRSSLLIVSALVCASMAAATAEIHDAVKVGDRVRIQSLVEKEPQSVNARDETGRAPLHWACREGNNEIVELLISRGAEVRIADDTGTTPLHAASTLDDAAAMRMLTDRGADPNARDLQGKTPLNLAATNGGEAAVHLLIERKADLENRDYWGRTPLLTGPYLGQKSPGKTPERFARGIVSGRYNLHSCIAFSPDGKEAMWSYSQPPRGSGFGSGRTLVTRLEGGRWTYPRPAVYGGVEVDDVPTFGLDGKKLYDMASRPLPGGPETRDENVWVWERSGSEWTRPKPVPGAVNEVPLHWQFGVDKQENVYVSTNVPGGMGKGDIYVSRYDKGRYGKPESLGDGVNTPADESTPFVSPDGRTLLFNRDLDLYASFLGKDGKWGEAVKLDGGVNTPSYELCPVLSPDGKHLFFMRGWAVYWVDAGVVENARAVQIARAGKRSAAAEIEQILGRGDVGTARARSAAMTGAEASAYFVDEPELITLGYRFLGERKVAEATAVFEMDARAFPDSWNAWDSLAEACLHSEDREKAEAYYAKSVALNPENQNGKDMLSELRGYKLDAAGETGTPARFLPGAETGLTGPYLGQAPPGLQAKVFAPGIVSTSGNFAFTLAFSPDGKGLYFTRREGEGRNTIMVSRLAESGWTAPEEAAFAKGFPSNEPHVTPDGMMLYFGSRRPRPGVEGAEYGIWVVERASEGGWGEPRYHGPGMYVSVARGGNLYMTDVTNVIRRGAIVYPRADGRYAPPRWLGGGVNAPKVADHMVVSPDESLILLDSPNRPGGQGGDGDLWVCFRQPDGTWSGALNLGDGVNDATTQFCPALSPDGKYIFFSTKRDIYWVSATVLDPLREKALGPGPAGAGSSSPIPISRKTVEQKGGVS